jgi:hypothetical protein
MNFRFTTTLNYSIIEFTTTFKKGETILVLNNYNFVVLFQRNEGYYIVYNKTPENENVLLEDAKREYLQYMKDRHLSELIIKAWGLNYKRELKRQKKEENEKNRIKNINKKKAKFNKKYFRLNVLKELIEIQFHPSNIDKFEGWGFDQN